MDPQYQHDSSGSGSPEVAHAPRAQSHAAGPLPSDRVHVLAHRPTCLLIPCHTKRAAIIFLVVLIPGWESPWKASKTVRRQERGTTDNTREKTAIEHILVHETNVLLRSEKSLRLFVDKVFKNCFVKKAVL